MPLSRFTIDVESRRVVHLADDGILGVLGVTADELTTEWRVEALMYPSPRVRGADNLGVIVDRLRDAFENPSSESAWRVL